MSSDREKEIPALIVIYLIKLFELWTRYTKVFFFVGKEDSYRIAQKYERKFMQLFKESVFREVVHVSSLDQMLSLQAEYVLTVYAALLTYIIFASPTRNRQMVQSIRSSEYYKKLKSSKFELLITRPELTGQPIILEQYIDTYADFGCHFIAYS